MDANASAFPERKNLGREYANLQFSRLNEVRNALIRLLRLLG
jgi:hypothetical protein